MTIYVAGDLQGCLDPLLKLLERVKFDDKSDKLWLTGDLVNRGPQSLETLEFVYKHKYCIKTVLGNHDLHLLAIAEDIRDPSSSDTLKPILKSPNRDELLYWLRHQPLIFHHTKKQCTMVHAGIPPIWSIKKALKRAGEVESILRSDDYIEFLCSMYGNTPSHWQSGLDQLDRWRIITNYFTRMRFCTAKGKLNLIAKGSPDSPPQGFLPWFAHEGRKTTDDTILFGHWAALQGHTGDAKAIALDTGYVWGQKLTLMRLKDGKRFTISH